MTDQREPGGAADLGNRALEGALVGVLAAMAVMVFGNVVLRYGFASVITVREELSPCCLCGSRSSAQYRSCAMVGI